MRAPDITNTYLGHRSGGSSMFGIATRLAIALSVLAAVAAVTLEAIGDVSPVTLVLTVAAIGFVTSWVMTGRVQQPQAIRHRVSVIPISDRVG
jgi:hypothetical protein